MMVNETWRRHRYSNDRLTRAVAAALLLTLLISTPTASITSWPTSFAPVEVR